MNERELAIRKRAALRLFEGLSDKALAEFFYEAVAARKAGSRFHLALAAVYPRNGGGVNDVFLVGPHHGPTYAAYPDGWSDDALVCQFGECTTCGSSVVSWAKSAVCPACGSQTNCT